MAKNEIKLNLTEEDMTLLVGLLALAEREKPGASRHATHLRAEIELAWLEVPERKKAQAEAEEKLQDLRGFLFRLKGFLEAEAAGFPRQDLVWAREAIEIVKTLQLEV